METLSKLPNRQAYCLQGYDYTLAGGYFVTLVAKDRRMVFGDVVADQVVLNAAGELIQSEWIKIVDRFPSIMLDEFIVMPNHFHAILFLTNMRERVESVGAGLVPARKQMDEVKSGKDKEDVERGVQERAAPTLSDVVGAFKSITAVRYIENVKTNSWLPLNGQLWQRSFYDRIIRNEEELHHLREYVHFNVAKWPQDEENPVYVQR